jgi:hypothetical protein
MPKRHDFERFVRRKGFSLDESAPGDHKRLHVDGKKVQVNYVRGEVDFASMKKLSRVLGLPLREVLQQVST